MIIIISMIYCILLSHDRWRAKERHGSVNRKRRNAKCFALSAHRLRDTPPPRVIARGGWYIRAEEGNERGTKELVGGRKVGRTLWLVGKLVNYRKQIDQLLHPRNPLPRPFVPRLTIRVDIRPIRAPRIPL